MPHAHVELIVGAVRIAGDPHGPTLRDALEGYWRARSRYSAVKLSEEQIAERVDLAVERVSTAAVHAVQGLQAPLEGGMNLVGLVSPVRA